MNEWEANSRNPRVDGSGITVITPTIPGRYELLGEAVMSVRAQTLPAVEHLILYDAWGEGPAVTRNRLLRMVRTPWVAFLDDDDVLDPDHLEVLHARVLESPGAAVAWSWHRGGPPTPRCRTMREAARYMSAGRNVIPVTVLALTSSVIASGGFDPDARYEDYDLWMRMEKRGLGFAVVPRDTWTYRLQAESRTHA